MKKLFLLPAGFALCLCFAPAIGNARTLSATPIQGAYDKGNETTKTFSGTVMKQGDVYVLNDKSDKTNYELDDAKKADKFVGKAVKVTGTLDSQNLTIHVITIQEIS
ncbi:MAG: hypothetical protein LAO19_00460 [Acidobacteriia bacterium]|nr:hypothetical protein [Terriglobia bacterium]